MSNATRLIRSLFDLPASPPRRSSAVGSIDARWLTPGRVTLITGPSGSGKSLLLRRLRSIARRRGVRWISPAEVCLPDRPVIDIAAKAAGGSDEDHTVERALALLSRVGLAEAWLYLRRPVQLSDGQRWRLILALAVAEASRGGGAVTVIAIDEFAALLDRVTAAIVARALRRLIQAHTMLGAVVVTSHDDLLAALDPDFLVEIDFDAPPCWNDRRAGA